MSGKGKFIFKVRFNHPNKVNTTPNLNVRHLEYIATRPGAVYNKGQKHCLFGKVKGNKFQDLNDLKDIKKYVEEKSLEQKTIYKCVVSFDNQTAKKNYRCIYGGFRWR